MAQLTQTTAEIQKDLDGVCAEIYIDSGSTAQSITNGASYVLITGFSADGANGVSINGTADKANNKLTLTENGTYEVKFHISFNGDSSNENWFFAIFNGGVEAGNIHSHRKIGTGSDVGSTGAEGLITVSSAPVDIDLRTRHGNATAENITVEYGNVTAVRIGG